MIPNADTERQRWLESRRHSIGGSDVAAILGFSRWSSPFSVWLEKTGAMPDEDASVRQLVGLLAEPMIAKLTRLDLDSRQPDNRYRLVRDADSMIDEIRKHSTHAERLRFETFGVAGETILLARRDDFPLCHATPDGVLVDDDQGSQCVHNAAVCGLPGSLLSALVGFGDLKTDFIEAADDPASNLEFVSSWYERHVRELAEPEAGAQDLDLIRKLHPACDGRKLNAVDVLDPEALEHILMLDSRYEEAHAIEKDGKERKEGIKARVGQVMGDAEELHLTNGVVWTNRQTKKGHRQLNRRANVKP